MLRIEELIWLILIVVNLVAMVKIQRTKKLVDDNLEAVNRLVQQAERTSLRAISEQLHERL